MADNNMTSCMSKCAKRKKKTKPVTKEIKNIFHIQVVILSYYLISITNVNNFTNIKSLTFINKVANVKSL